MAEYNKCGRRADICYTSCNDTPPELYSSIFVLQHSGVDQWRPPEFK